MRPRIGRLSPLGLQSARRAELGMALTARVLLRRWAPACARAAPCAVRAPVYTRCAAALAPAARAISMAAPRAQAAPSSRDVDLLPDLPSEAAQPGGEVGWLYDGYATGGAAAAGGIVDFSTKLVQTKERKEPLPEVRMSNHSKHALHISRHKLNDLCRTIRGLSVHVSRRPPAIRTRGSCPVPRPRAVVRSIPPCLSPALARAWTHQEAEVQLYFSQKRIATAVRGLLAKTVRVAKERGLDEERLFVAQAFVGRDTPLVRRRYHSMSRGGRVHKPRSQLTLVLQEVPHGDRRAVGRVVTHRQGRLPSTPRWKKPQ